MLKVFFTGNMLKNMIFGHVIRLAYTLSRKPTLASCAAPNFFLVLHKVVIAKVGIGYIVASACFIVFPDTFCRRFYPL